MKYFPIILWIMVWGGIYSTGWDRILPGEFLTGYEEFFRGLRTLLPLLAGAVALFVLLMVRKTESLESTPKKGPLLLLSLYGITGGFFFFFSPRPSISFYWAALFLSVPYVAWAIIKGKEYENARLLMNVNWAIIVSILLLLIVFPMQPVLLGGPNTRIYELPLGLGTQTANGVGRFAAVAGLIALSRFRQKSIRKRLFYLIILAGSLDIIAFAQSRTAIIGFALGALVLVLISRKWSWLIIGGPGVAYLLYLSWFVWRFEGNFQNAFEMAGREYTWDRTLDMSLQSPFFGFGFHADRFLLEGEHVHMSYLHALIQSGIIGALFFIGAIIAIWHMIIRNNLFKRIPSVSGKDNLLLVESIAVLTFLTARSFFESTAAFYGVDLLILVPVIAYIQVWVGKNPQIAHSS